MVVKDCQVATSRMAALVSSANLVSGFKKVLGRGVIGPLAILASQAAGAKWE